MGLERAHSTVYHVLLPVDDSTDRALDQARTVADLPISGDRRVTVFHVFTGAEGGGSVTQVAAARRAREHLEDEGVEVALDESSGEPATEILAAADEHDVDLVTLAGRRRSPAGKVLMGSISQRVLLEADRPVLFCPTVVGEPEG